jgi:acylphosphatase
MRSGEQARGAAIVVEGKVQGVGYRDFVQRRARRLDLTGYVMNLPDGRVRVRAEGSPESIEELIREMEKGPPLARVEKVSATWLPPTRRFADFSIRFAEFDG